MHARRGQKFEGVETAGTAQVLSVQPVISTANWSGVVMCRVGLRVEIPGRPPYDVATKTTIPPTMVYSVQGRTVPVQVDSANLQNVRVDLSQPPLQPGSFESQSTPQAMSYVGSSYGYMPPGMRRLGIAAACFLGIWTLAAFAYQAHALWGISTYAVVPITIFLILAVPLGYFTYRRTRRDGQPTSQPESASFGWSGPTTGNVTYGEQPALDAPPPPPASPYDSLSPGIRMYIRVMWGLVAFGFIAAIVVLVVVLLIARHWLEVG